MTHKEIIMTLVGPINPIGETNTDEQRFENLKHKKKQKNWYV